jgi:CRISPR/Cas system-associated protein Cas5 (RAMP superfamily)
MVWIRADYEFGSLFSYRIPDFSSQYAISSILPGPSAIKLAIVSTAIEITGNVEYGKEIFEIIKNGEIKIQLPRRISQTNVLIKRLKSQDISKQKTKLKGDCEKCGKKNTKLWEIDEKKLCKECASKLIQTFGIRSYVHYPEKFSIYIDIPEDKFKEFEKILKSIRYFGTSDSLVWCKSANIEEPPNDAISAVETLKNEDRNVIIIPVKDINPDVGFDDINIYQKKKVRKDLLLKRFYILPISKLTQGKNWIVYEFSQ